jgi:hypothetical protein
VTHPSKGWPPFGGPILVTDASSPRKILWSQSSGVSLRGDELLAVFV